ncbi:MAG: hypothetical protein K9M98_11255 [Cephaloticoccus sp.]|nr:hypothetical protein [Cephaloticoccus sp.]
MLKLKFALPFILISTLVGSAPLAAEAGKPDDIYSDWAKSLYRTQDLSRFDGYWAFMLEKNGLEARNLVQPVLGFVNRVLHQHPELLKGRFDDLSKYPKAQRATLARLLWLSDTPEARQILEDQGQGNYLKKTIPPIENWEIKGAQDLDFCWGWFMATGDTAAVKPIVRTLDLGKDAGAIKRYATSEKTEADRQAAYNDAWFGAALWSLTSFGKTDERVATFLEQQFADPSTPKTRKTWLAMILGEVFPGKYKIKIADEPDRVGLELPAIDRTLAEVGAHAKNYPPKFGSTEEREKTEAKLRDVLNQLDAVLLDRPDDRELLMRAGMAHSMGHNLDFAESAKRCTQIYDHVLAMNPEDAWANLHYGIFLSGSRRQEQGMVCLEKALALGVKEANYPLAIACLTLEDPVNARVHLERYVADFPQDGRAMKLLQLLRDDKVTFKRQEWKSPGT